MGSPQAPLPLTTSTAATPWPTLPSFPHPASLFAGHGNPFVVGEASSATSALDKLKDDIRSGVYDLSLPPPGSSSLPPLPPIPIPPVNVSRKRSSIVALDKTGNPLPKPPLPSSLQKEIDLKSALDQWQPRATISAIPSTSASSHKATATRGIINVTLSPRGDSILFELGEGRAYGAIWAILRSMKTDGAREDGHDVRNVKVQQVKIFSPEESKSVPLIHQESQNVAYRDFGKHLTKLELSAPDLLYRLPHIPALLSSPCFHCSKMLVSPDGLPAQGSGFLPISNKGKIAAQKMSKADNKRDTETVKQEKGGSDDKSDDKEAAEGEDGRWVCWHASCEP